MNDRVPLVTFVNHSAELGGGELALLDLARATPRARAVLLSDGPLNALLAEAGTMVRTIDAGRVLEIRRTDGLLAALGKCPGLFALGLRLASEIRRSEVVYANSQKAFVAVALAAFLTRRPLLWHLHDILDGAHFSGPIRKVAITLSNRFAHGVIANSIATADAYRKAGGRSPVTVIHNGIDSAKFDPGKRTQYRAELASAIGSGSSPIIGLFGRLAAWKGQHVAIEALTQMPGVHLVLVGGALFDETPYENDLRAQVAAANLTDRVHFLGFRQDIPELMGGVDVAIHCSTAPEPFGRVIVEAMMAGTPVIASAAGGALEIVDDGETGLLVPSDAPELLATALRKLFDDPAGAQRMATQALGMATSRFSLDASVTRLHAQIATAAFRHQDKQPITK